MRYSSENLSPVIVLDNVLSDPDEIRQEILRNSSDVWIDHPDLGRVSKPETLRKQQSFYEMLFGCLLGVSCSCVSWICSRLEGEEDLLSIFPSYSIYDYFGVLYLHPNPPPDTGAVFFKHSSGLRELSYSELFSPLYQSEDLQDWSVCDTLSNEYNRLILFPGGRVARVLSGYGTDVVNGGLVHIFNITRTGEKTL
jgi:hypothetical protein